MWLTVLECHAVLSTARLFSWACILIRGKTLRSRSQELSVPLSATDRHLRRCHPIGWNVVVCQLTGRAHVQILQRIAPVEGWQSLCQCCTIATGVKYRHAGIYPWEGYSNVIKWAIFEIGLRMAGRHYHQNLRVPVEYPEVGKVRAGAPQWWRDRDPGETGSSW